MSDAGAATRAAHELAAEMCLLNGRRAGDYVMVVKATAGEDGGITYTWDWWWRPPGTVAHEGAGVGEVPR